jgi:signal transduction histidine kinase
MVNASRLSETALPARRLVSQLASLAEISVTLNSTLDLDDLLQFIIDTAARILDCEAASILLFDEESQQLRFAASTELESEKLAQIPVPLDGSIAGSIFRHNRGVLINDVRHDPRHYALVGEQIAFRPRSLIGVPMRMRERVMGVLEALNKRQGPFNEGELRLLAIIAAQAAVAIQNARLLQQLRQANQELSRIDRLKNDFMAIASQELRAPLRVILDYATGLQAETHGRPSEHASAVLSSALRLQVVVEALTNMNLLQIGSISLQLQPIDLLGILQTAYAEVQSTARAKNQQVRLEFPAQPVRVEADSARLKLAFVNLLNNAVRFTPPEGSIRIQVKTSPVEAEVAIIDNGIGIPASELENIFKEFYQPEQHLNWRHGGLGLGLAIARGLIRLHAGQIWAESPGLGQGATFRVVLPRLIR